MFPKRSVAISFAVVAALASLASAYQAPDSRGLDDSANNKENASAGQPGQVGPGAGQSASSGAVNAGPSGSLASAMANFTVRTGLVVGSDDQGRLIVEHVRPESDAARLGVKAGDVLTSVNGTETNTMRALQGYVTSHIGQSAFDVGMGRGSRTFRHPMGRQATLMGMTIFPNSADAPYVYSVDPDSPAAKAHVKPGDVITAVGHETTDTMSKFMNMAVPLVRALDPGEGVPLQVARNGQVVKVSVPRPKNLDLQPLTPAEQHVLDTQHGVLSPKTQEPAVPRERMAQKKPRRQNRGQQQQQNGMAALAAQPQGANQQQQPQNGLAGGGIGLGLDGLGGGLGTAGTGTAGTGTGTGTMGSGSGALPAVVAQLYGTSQNQLSNNSTNSSQASQSGRGGNRNNFSNSGVIGYVTIQSSVPLNASANGLNNSGTTNGTNGTTGTTGGTTNTGTGATNGLGTSNAAGVLNNNSFGSPTPGFNNSATGTNGSTGANPTPTIGEGGTNPLTGNTGTTPGVNPQTGNTGNGNANTNSNYPSTISAQVNGLPSGTYGLVISQYGNCGDAAAVASGPAAYSVGSISVSSNGVGQISNVSVPYPPQAFVGRVVTLVPPTAAGSGSGAIAGRNQTQSAGNNASSQRSNQVFACGVFMSPNGQQNFSNSAGNYNGSPGIFGPGMGPGPGNTNTGNGNNGTNNGTNGNGTGTGGVNIPPMKPLQNGGAAGAAGGGVAAPAGGVGR
jgi:membrane-associated protease RseP (regulator of RpoE activity)